MTRTKQESEKHLIDQIRRGDERAFETLLHSYNSKVYGYFFRVFGCPETAKDLFQETFLKVWRNIDRFDPQKRFDAWLFTIVHRVAIDALRANGKQPVNEALEPERYSGTENPAGDFLHKELQENIAAAVRELPEKQQRVFLMRQHGELTFREIAEIMNEPLNSVLSHMHYAVKKLRKALKEAYETGE